MNGKLILVGMYLPIFVLAMTVATIYLSQWWRIMQTDGADLPYAQLSAGIGIAFLAHGLDMLYWGLARLSDDWYAWAFDSPWPIILIRALLTFGALLHFDMWAFARGQRWLVRVAICSYFVLWGMGIALLA